MSAIIIELNDGAIKIGTGQGIIAQSPGFALVKEDSLVLGDEAEQQARLQPTKSYNKYWHELSMEGLNHDNHIRHTADIAYAHLVHLAEIGEIDSDVVFAVPGNFTNQQLAILLGLAKQSPLNPVGIVDTAVAAAVAADAQNSAVYIDYQQHQVVLTQIETVNGLATAQSVVQIPGAGIQNFINLLMQQATDLFIEQCRFNPQHNAEYEQLLYNQLPAWLHQYDESQTNLILELKTTDSTHTAKMPKEGLIASLNGRYKSIVQELKPLLSSAQTKIVLGERLSTLPGFLACLPIENTIVTLKDDAITKTCLANGESIIKAADSMHLVKSLPLAAIASEKNRNDAKTELAPTHLLVAHNAIPLRDKSSISNAVEVSVNGAGIFVDSDQEYWLNQAKVVGQKQLQLGDTLKFVSSDQTMTAIRVNDG